MLGLDSRRRKGTPVLPSYLTLPLSVQNTAPARALQSEPAEKVLGRLRSGKFRRLEILGSGRVLEVDSRTCLRGLGSCGCRGREGTCAESSLCRVPENWSGRVPSFVQQR